MLNLIENLNQKGVFVLVIAFLLMLNTCGHSSMRKEIAKNRTEIDSLQSVIATQYTAQELDTRLRILSLEQEKSTLFNVNYIVLTKQRPDIRMNQIDQEIGELKKQLSK
jgi:hypothetical protein